MRLPIATCALMSLLAAVSGVRAQDATSETKLREEIVALKQSQEDLRLKLRELEIQNRELMLTIREVRLEMQVLSERLRVPALASKSRPEATADAKTDELNVESQLELLKEGEPEPEATADEPVSSEADDLLKLGIDAANQKSDYANAVEILSRAIALNPFETKAFFHRGVAHHYLKHYVEAMADFTTAAEYSKSGPVRQASLYNIACGHAVLGNRLHALNLLEKALDEGFREFVHMREDPDLASIRDDPRYIELIKTYDESTTEDGP